jgi:xylulokinase
MNSFLAIDLGTSNCRSAVFSEDMQMIAVSAVEYPLISISAAHIEQDALMWWDAVKHTIKDVAAKSGEFGKSVRSLAISSQGISFVPVDKDSNPLMNAISWLDLRAQKEEEQLEAQYGINKIFNITGKRANACYTLPKLVWLKRNLNSIYNEAEKLLLPLDYIQCKLCGKAVTDHTMASGTMFYDIHNQKWAEDILSEQGIDYSKLPEIGWSGSVLGTISPSVAADLGLDKEVMVVIGGQDQKCAALGAGISAESATASLGTASCITQLSKQPILDSQLRIPCFSYLLPETWSFEGIINTAASSYQWFRQNFAPQYSYQQLDELATKAANIGQRAFFYPYLAGMTSPFWGNGSGCFTGLSLSTDIGQLALAILDGVACNIKANLDVMQSIYQPVQELRLFGGGTKSPLWCQIISDMLNLPVATQRSPETALLGAAMLAKYGFDNKKPLVQDSSKVFYPIPENVQVYEEYYSNYIETLNKQFECNYN